jgi:hypothetical protein
MKSARAIRLAFSMTVLAWAILGCGYFDRDEPPAPTITPTAPASPPAPAPPPAPVAPAPAPAPTAPPAAPGAPAPAGGLALPESFGVEECDAYARRACNCRTEMVRAQMCSAASQAFETWRSAVNTSPMARDAIRQGCQSAAAGLVQTCGE